VIQKYEYSFDGSTWISAGTALFVDIDGRTAGASYTMRARALDPAGNPSTVRMLVVVMQAASGGTNSAPTMAGSLSITNQTSSGYRINWQAATDADGNLAGYDYSINGGTSFTQLGNVLFVDVSGRPASTADQVRVRARDVPGLTSNVLSAAASTTAAASTCTFSRFGGDQKTTSFAGVAVTRATTNVGTYDGYIAFSPFAGINDAYLGVSPVPAGIEMGWGPSNTEAPPSYASNTDPGMKSPNGGMIPADGAGTFTNGRYFTCAGNMWIPTAAGTYTRYPWAKLPDGTKFCLSPNSPCIITLA